MNNKLYAISAATVAVMIFLSFVSCGGDDSADKEDSNNNVIRTQCSSCNGTGTRQCVDCNNKGVCTWCHGDGTCDTCNGSGWIDLGGDFSIRQRCGHYKEVWTGNTWYISDKCQCYNSGKCAGCNGESTQKQLQVVAAVATLLAGSVMVQASAPIVAARVSVLGVAVRDGRQEGTNASNAEGILPTASVRLAGGMAVVRSVVETGSYSFR